MKTSDAIMIECVGPRCSSVGMSFWIRMSESGMTDSVRARGMLMFIFSIFADVLPEIYPNARWPTANELGSSCRGLLREVCGVVCFVWDLVTFKCFWLFFVVGGCVGGVCG